MKCYFIRLNYCVRARVCLYVCATLYLIKLASNYDSLKLKNLFFVINL